MSNHTDILDYISPFIIAAGDYAKAVQKKIGSQPAKGGNPFSSALTDADLSIQAFIEVALLASFSDIKFYGEEHASSLNMKYFKQNSELCVFLDPIDGTRFYQDNFDNFNVILSIVEADQIAGVLMYVPRRDLLFRAEKGQGAVCWHKEEFQNSAAGRPVRLVDNNLVVTYDNPELSRRLASQVEVQDIAADYSKERCCHCVNSLLLGETSATVGRNSGLIDWGAMAFIAEEAGALVSDLSGNPLPAVSELQDLSYPSIVVATTEKLHRLITEP